MKLDDKTILVADIDDDNKLKFSFKGSENDLFNLMELFISAICLEKLKHTSKENAIKNVSYRVYTALFNGNKDALSKFEKGCQNENY